MLFIFSTPVLIRHLWQPKTFVYLHWCLLCTVPLRATTYWSSLSFACSGCTLVFTQLFDRIFNCCCKFYSNHHLRCFTFPSFSLYYFILLSKSNVCREIGQLFPMYTKGDVIQGASQLSQHGVTWRQANSTCMPPDQKSKQS